MVEVVIISGLRGYTDGSWDICLMIVFLDGWVFYGSCNSSISTIWKIIILCSRWWKQLLKSPPYNQYLVSPAKRERKASSICSRPSPTSMMVYFMRCRDEGRDNNICERSGGIDGSRRWRESELIHGERNHCAGKQNISPRIYLCEW